MLVAPRSSALVITAALALGCAVGEGGNGFSSGAVTFGNVSAEGGPGGSASGDDAEDESTGGGSATSQGTGGNDSGSDAGESPPADTVDCTPTDELCNGLDDDCDGTPDNGDPEAGQVCNTGNPGVCANGISSCQDGMLVCAPDTAASAESCNGLDDDCNGQIDDGVGGGAACNTGMAGVCADGQTSCAGGGEQCVPLTGAQAESCNGLDDDCNGQVDNGNPGGGGGCNTGLPGICGPGTQQCSGGNLICQQNQGAVGEVCGNGVDEDCNGQADNGCCAHDICVTGVVLTVGCDPCVAQICAVDSYCCNTAWDSYCVSEVGSVCGLVC